MQHTLTTAASLPAWHHAIRIGDVVLFRHLSCDVGETPKSGACLVFNIEVRGGKRVVELAYATSDDTAANIGAEIPVNDPAAMTAPGLHRPTRFVCARRIFASLDHPGWDLDPRYGTPVVGHLDARALSRLHAIRAKVEAVCDIAAERRRERIIVRRPSTPADFTVEHRRRGPVTTPSRPR